MNSREAIFYAPPERFDGDVIELPESEVHHASSVMRLSAGDVILVVDGNGTACTCELTKLGRKKGQARIVSRRRNMGETSVHLTLAAGLSTGSKFDTVVQKGTELGVKRFVPLICEKAKVKLEDPKRALNRVKRLERVALAAMKQSRRSFLPQISAPVGMFNFIGEVDDSDFKLIFSTAQDARPLDALDISDVSRVTLIVGPESGFTEGEQEAAQKGGFAAVTLGERILRTETAGPVVTALVLQRLGEFR